MFPPLSRCAAGEQLTYVWVSRTGEKNDIEAAVDALMACLEKPGRLWNMWNRAAAKAEFRRVLQRAELGELKPVDEVKYLGRGSSAWIYEIRWQNLSVQVLQDDQSVEFEDLMARALHAEAPQLPNHLLGLHAHEKIVVVVAGDEEATNAATRAAQDAEIDIAVDIYWNRGGANWGSA